MSNGVKYAVATVAVVVAAAAGGGYFFLQHQVDQKVAELKEQGIEVAYNGLGVTPSGYATLSDVTADVNGQALTAEKVSFSLLPGAQAWTADNLELVAEANAVRVAHIEGMTTALSESSTSGEMSVSAAGIQIPLGAIADSEEEAANMREIFGADTVSAELAIKASYDQEKLALSYNFGSELFKVDLNGAFGGLDFVALARKVEQQPENSEALGMELMQLQLSSFAINLADSGLVDKLVAAEAKEQSITTDEVRAQWALGLGEMTAQLREAGIDGSEAWAVELDKLGQSWKGVNFSLNPAEPVPLMSLMMMAQMDPNEAVKMLQPQLQAL